MERERRLIGLLSEIYDIKKPSLEVTKKELPYYEDGIIFMSEQMTYSEERFYYLIHEFVHHLTNYAHEDYFSEEEQAFDRLVGVLYYVSLLLMSEEDYEAWFNQKRNIRAVIEGLFEYVSFLEST